MIILEVLLGIVTIVLYIILRVQLLNETRTIYKAGYLAVGLGVFAMIWATVKDIRDPDFEEGPESNWNKALNSIINSVNKESNEDKD